MLKETIHPILPFRFTGQEIDEHYAFLDGIPSAGNLVEGTYSVAWEQAPCLAFRAVVVAMAVRVLTQEAINK